MIIKLKNTIVANKIFFLSIFISLFFALLLFPPVQNLCLFAINKFLHKTIVLDSVWKNRFIEHSIKCIGILLSCGAVLQFFKPLSAYSKKKEQKTKRKSDALFFAYFLFCSFLILSVCSTCSFLYPFHTWDDSNCFFTVGKSVWFGKVIYKDLFEQKGPLLYFIHSLAYLISHRTFTGVFVFELIAAAFFMFFCWKSIALFSDTRCGILVPFIASIAYSSTSFVLGDSAEEFCLPFFMYSLYVSTKHLKEESDFKNSEFFVTGILAGCVLWIKFSLLGFYIGWCIVPIFTYARQKRWKEIIIAFVLVFAGVLLATLPYLIYFGLNRSIKDWLEVYIYDNIFLYTSDEKGNFLVATLKGLFRFYWRNYFYFFASVLSFISIIKLCRQNNKTIIAHFITTYIFMSLFIYGGGQWYEYYRFDLILISIFAVLPLYDLLIKITRHIVLKKAKVSAVFLSAVFTSLSFLCAFAITGNKEIMKLKKDDLPQYKFDKIISEYKNPTLLNYGTLDCGFYTVSGIVPSNRFFIKIHVPLKEMDDEQNRIIKNGTVDFVVSKTPINSSKYDLISTAESNIKNHHYTFYLYKNVLL